MSKKSPSGHASDPTVYVYSEDATGLADHYIEIRPPSEDDEVSFTVSDSPQVVTAGESYEAISYEELLFEAVSRLFGDGEVSSASLERSRALLDIAARNWQLENIRTPNMEELLDRIQALDAEIRLAGETRLRLCGLVPGSRVWVGTKTGLELMNQIVPKAEDLDILLQVAGLNVDELIIRVRRKGYCSFETSVQINDGTRDLASFGDVMTYVLRVAQIRDR